MFPWFVWICVPKYECKLGVNINLIGLPTQICSLFGLHVRIIYQYKSYETTIISVVFQGLPVINKPHRRGSIVANITHETLFKIKIDFAWPDNWMRCIFRFAYKNKISIYFTDWLFFSRNFEIHFFMGENKEFVFVWKYCQMTSCQFKGFHFFFQLFFQSHKTEHTFSHITSFFSCFNMVMLHCFDFPFCLISILSVNKYNELIFQFSFERHSKSSKAVYKLNSRLFDYHEKLNGNEEFSLNSLPFLGFSVGKWFYSDDLWWFFLLFSWNHFSMFSSKDFYVPANA